MSLITGHTSYYCAEGGWSLGTYNYIYYVAAGRRLERGLGNGGGGWSRAFSHGGGESDSVGPSPMVTEVGRYAQISRPDGQLSQHL